MDESSPIQADGRRRRSERSRDAIVDAMVALVGQGHITPSAELVAERASVGLRTVFRHFRDMDSLYAGMADRLAGQYEAWLSPFTGDDWREKLDEMTARRLATYERLMPFKRAADAHRHGSATIQQNHAARLAIMRERLMSLLPDEVRREPARAEAIDMLLSFECWQRLRTDQYLAPAAAEAVIRHAVTAVLGQHD